jgi:hypothetical protein
MRLSPQCSFDIPGQGEHFFHTGGFFAIRSGKPRTDNLMELNILFNESPQTWVILNPSQREQLNALYHGQ